MLTTLIFMPAAAALLLSFTKKAEDNVLYRLLVAAALVPFLMVLQAWPHFVPSDPLEPMASLSEFRDWIPAIGAFYSLRLDGLNLPFLTLVTFIGLAAHLIPPEEEENLRRRGALLLLWEAALIGSFLAQDYILFLLFWAVSSAPIYFLMKPGSEDGQLAAQSFLLSSLVSILALGAGLLIFSGSLGAAASVSAEEAVNTVTTGLDPDTQWWIFLTVFIGCGLRVPIFPLHIWLRAAMDRLPVSANILLVGGFLPLGISGLLRLAVMVLTDAAAAFTGAIAAAGTINLIFGALAALGSEDRCQKTAYLVMSCTGIALLGTATLTIGGITGALYTTLSLGLAAAFSLSIATPSANAISQRWRLMLHGLDAAQHLRLPGFAGFIGLFLVFTALYQNFRPLSVSIFAALFVTGVDYARSLAGLMDSMPGDTAQGETQDSLPSSLALLLKGAGAAAVLLLGGSILLGVKPDLFLGVVEPTVKGLMPFLE